MIFLEILRFFFSNIYTFTYNVLWWFILLIVIAVSLISYISLISAYDDAYNDHIDDVRSNSKNANSKESNGKDGDNGECRLDDINYFNHTIVSYGWCYSYNCKTKKLMIIACNIIIIYYMIYHIIETLV